MRICLYTNTALPKVGGQEIVIDALARQFLALGHEPVVLAPWRRSQGPFDAASVPYAVAWHPRFISTYWLVSWYGRWMAKLPRAKPHPPLRKTCDSYDVLPLNGDISLSV